MPEFHSRFENIDRRVPIDEHNCAVQFDVTKCKNCTLCRRACADTQTVLDYYSLSSTGDLPICVHCGQCATACPFDAINEVNDVGRVKEALKDPDKIVIFQTAPAVRVGLGEAFGMEPGSFVEGQMVSALRALGADYVFDTDFGADMTIMEEAMELLHRLQSEEIPIPQFTSCCPAWVEFAETFYPDLIPHLSSTKSPISILSPIIKTYFAQQKNIDPKKIVNVCVTPCTAKKSEIRRPQLSAAGLFWDEPEIRDTDICITTRELAKWIQEENIDFDSLENSQFDKDFIPFEPVRGLQGVKKATVIFGHFVIHVAAISGLANARAFIDDLIKEDAFEDYSFIEIMACPGGCIGGGGQPKVKMPQIKKVQEARTASLYQSDADTDVKASWQNPEIAELYEVFLDEPLSEMAEFTLHTYFSDKSDQLGRMKNLTPQTNPMSPKYKPPTAE